MFKNLRYIRVGVIFFLLTTQATFANSCEIQLNKSPVSGEVNLDSGCIYRGMVEINSSNTILNCNGATLDSSDNDYGILIDSKGHKLNNVHIKNCKVLNARKNGIMITWVFPGPEKLNFTREEIYEKSPELIKISDSVISKSGNVGIFVGDYTQFTEIDNVDVSLSGAVGVYLEHSSKNNTIKQSRFFDNGVKYKREAIAIDSSSGNIVKNNLIKTSFGGIFLYKNCGENKNSRFHVNRWQSASSNIIENNVFEDLSIAVWLASRQSKNLRNMQCSSEPYFGDAYFEDDSKNNVVKENKIYRVNFGVIIEDSANSVIGNSFYSIGKYAIKLDGGLRYRTINVPVSSTVIYNNKFYNVKSSVYNPNDFKINEK